MRTLIVGMGIALMLTGAAWGQTQVDFSLGLKSQAATDAYVNGWKVGGPYVAFGHGAATLGEADTSGKITWDVTGAVSGTDATNYPATGLANVVFNLTLKDEAGNPVATVYTSRINDGTPGGPVYPIVGQSNDPVEMAAFPTAWGVNLDYSDEAYPGNLDVTVGAHPGRLYDPVSEAGPFMDRIQFPSTTAHGGGRITGGTYQAGGSPTGIATSDLVGMGIGYSQFVVADPGDPLSGGNAAGVGIVGSITSDFGSWTGLGANPIAEGQIDTSTLAAGTYTLELTVPVDGEGNPIGQNVIPGQYVQLNPGYSAGGFAEKADNVTRDGNGVAASATFVVGIGPSTPVQPVAWSSVRLHGNGVGELPIALSMTDGTTTSECRNGGIQKLVIVFDGDLTLANYAGANIGITGAGLTVLSQSLAMTNVANDTLIVNLTGTTTDRSCYTFSVTGVCDLKVAADPTCSVRALIADVGNDGRANVADYAAVKSKNGQPVNAANVKYDVNVDGRINVADYALTKSKNNAAQVLCP